MQMKLTGMPNNAGNVMQHWEAFAYPLLP